MPASIHNSRQGRLAGVYEALVAQPNATVSSLMKQTCLSRPTITTLLAWADVPELEMTLTAPDGRNLNVTFRTHDGALQASPVRWMHDEDDDAWYHAEIRLMTI